MAFTKIENSDSGLSARTELNAVIDYLNRLGLDIQFSDNGTDWHYPWSSGDDFIRFSGDFGATWSSGLNFGGSGSTWDSAIFDDTTGGLSFFVGAVLAATVNLDGRYALATDAAKNTYSIYLPSSGSVGGRVSSATAGTDYPTGWVLAAGSSPIDLDITHGLGRRVANVSVFAVTGTQEQMLIGTAAFNGIITSDANSLRIQSLATIPKAIKIYITFA